MNIDPETAERLRKIHVRAQAEYQALLDAPAPPAPPEAPRLPGMRQRADQRFLECLHTRRTSTPQEDT
jgi:hypothetical protein